MKKIKIILVLFCILNMVTIDRVVAMSFDPKSECPVNDNLCVVNETHPLFTICNKEGENCQTINTENINENHKYDLFEIKNKEIYLENADITLEFLNIWSLLNYKIHISGTNKIEKLYSYNMYETNDKLLNPSNYYAYEELYSKKYIPFSVEGDGTLEIVKAAQIKKNTSGETYYKCWRVIGGPRCDNGGNIMISNEGYKAKSEDYKLLGNIVTGTVDRFRCLMETSIDLNNNTVTVTMPKQGYTLSDIKAKFSNDIESLVIVPYANWGNTYSMLDFLFPELREYANDTDNLLTQEGRIQFINRIYNDGIAHLETLKTSPWADIPGCDKDPLIPMIATTELGSITADWGSENIETELSRSFSNTGSYLINFPEEKEKVKAVTKDNIVFESTEEFDPNYHLVVEDITEKITDIQSASVQAKTDKTLLELYDIYMVDQDDNIVDLGDGTYKIKVELNDMLKKYEKYQVIYISEDNKVELIDAEVEGEHIVFYTTHLSKYGIVGSEIKKTGSIVNPNTADSVITYGLILGALVVTITLVLLRIKKLREA